MGVGALSALLGGAADGGARTGREAGQNQLGQQQPPSQASRPTVAPQPAPAVTGSDSLSRSDLMRMICGDSFDAEDSAPKKGNDSNKRRKVDAPASEPPAKTSSASGHAASNDGGNGPAAEKSNGLFSVSLPSDDSDSDDSD